MGRPKLKTDKMAILKMRKEGCSLSEISRKTGFSTATLSRRIAELRNKEGLLTKYRELQGLRLTELQIKVLDAITPEKIRRASLIDLLKAFSILEKAERSIQGKEPDVNIKGNLLYYLLEVERREKRRI